MAEDKVKCCYDATSQEVIEEMVNTAPTKQDELTLQLDQVSQQKEKIDEQIKVLESCIEDCSANMVEGLLHELAKEATGNTIMPRGIWHEGKVYGAGPGRPHVVVAPIGTGSWGALICITSHASAPETKPFVGEYWTDVWANYPSITDHPDYVVTLGPTFNQKTYGNKLIDWKITDTTGTTIYYIYHGGPWYSSWFEIDDDIDVTVNDWNESNDMVTAPLGTEGFYGLKALSDALDKAKTGLTNTRNKITNMVNTLSRFI
jgi:hypothetical protein